MKKILAFFVLCSFYALASHAQRAVSSSEDSEFRSKIEKFLKEEGYVPSIDEDDDIIFKKEGELYWISVLGSEPYYIRLQREGYNSSSASNRKLILEACNNANMNIRCGKAWVSESTIGFSIEFFCHSLDAFKNSFNSNMNSLNRIYDIVTDYYNEHDE